MSSSESENHDMLASVNPRRAMAIASAFGAGLAWLITQLSIYAETPVGAMLGSGLVLALVGTPILMLPLQVMRHAAEMLNQLHAMPVLLLPRHEPRRTQVFAQRYYISLAALLCGLGYGLLLRGLVGLIS